MSSSSSSCGDLAMGKRLIVRSFEALVNIPSKHEGSNLNDGTTCVVACGGANLACGGGIVVPLSDGTLYECQRVYCYC